jgi:hypothetical protein
VDFNRFDDLARALTCAPYRRDVLRSLAAAGFGLATVQPTLLVEAKKKHKHKKHKKHKKKQPPMPNEFGCLNVNDPCTSAAQCCSGICEGTAGKRTCRAHDVGNCQAGTALENEIPCTTSGGDDGLCSTTTGNAGYCLITGDCRMYHVWSVRPVWRYRLRSGTPVSMTTRYPSCPEGPRALTQTRNSFVASRSRSLRS